MTVYIVTTNDYPAPGVSIEGVFLTNKAAQACRQRLVEENTYSAEYIDVEVHETQD